MERTKVLSENIHLPVSNITSLFKTSHGHIKCLVVIVVKESRLHEYHEITPGLILNDFINILSFQLTGKPSSKSTISFSHYVFHFLTPSCYRKLPRICIMRSYINALFKFPPGKGWAHLIFIKEKWLCRWVLNRFLVKFPNSRHYFSHQVSC